MGGGREQEKTIFIILLLLKRCKISHVTQRLAESYFTCTKEKKEKGKKRKGKKNGERVRSLLSYACHLRRL